MDALLATFEEELIARERANLDAVKRKVPTQLPLYFRDPRINLPTLSAHTADRATLLRAIPL